MRLTEMGTKKNATLEEIHKKIKETDDDQDGSEDEEETLDPLLRERFARQCGKKVQEIVSSFYQLFVTFDHSPYPIFIHVFIYLYIHSYKRQSLPNSVWTLN